MILWKCPRVPSLSSVRAISLGLSVVRVGHHLLLPKPLTLSTTINALTKWTCCLAFSYSFDKVWRHVLEHRYDVFRAFVEVRHSVWLLVSVIGKDRYFSECLNIQRRWLLALDLQSEIDLSCKARGMFGWGSVCRSLSAISRESTHGCHGWIDVLYPWLVVVSVELEMDQLEYDMHALKKSLYQ